MHVRWIELVGFRNHASLTFAPEPGLNVLVGKNGQGKTSLLEALHVLITGRSFRTAKLGDCLGWDAGGRAAVTGELATEARSATCGSSCTRGREGSRCAERSARGPAP